MPAVGSSLDLETRFQLGVMDYEYDQKALTASDGDSASGYKLSSALPFVGGGVTAFQDKFFFDIYLQKAFSGSGEATWSFFDSELSPQKRQLINADMKKTGKNISLSVAVKPNLNTAASRWSQDWASWLNKGLVSFVIPMNYYKEVSLYSQNIKLMRETLPDELLDRIIMGVATFNQDAESEEKFQFLRVGYFNVDHKNFIRGNPVFNRAVSLKSSYKPK